MKPIKDIEIKTLKYEDDGSIPNNPSFPILIYLNVSDTNDKLDNIIENNNWLNSWENGIFSYHHYHSNSHEVLLIVDGSAQLQLGGEQGSKVDVKFGDVLILPAGSGHKLLNESSNSTVKGAYPNGQSYDICVGKESERPQNLRNIKNTPLPDYDPIFGGQGPLFSYWKT